MSAVTSPADANSLAAGGALDAPDWPAASRVPLIARTPAQAGAVGAGVYLVLALLGGNFTGTAQTSGTYAVVQKLTPNGWLIQGWDTAMRGGGVLDVRWQLLVPLGFAVAFFFFAVLRMRRRFA